MKTKIAILFLLAICAAPTFGFAQSTTIKSVVAGGMDMSTSGSDGSGGTMATGEGNWPQAPGSGGRMGGPAAKSTFSEDLGSDFFYDPSKQETIVNDKIFQTAGYLTDDIKTVGEVIDGDVSNQASFSLGEDIFIDMGSEDGINVGDTFMVLHLSEEEVVHPHTRHLWIFARKSLGYKVEYDGVIEVVEVAKSVSRAEIKKSYMGIQRGDLIAPLDENIVPPALDPDKPPAEKSISGYIVASQVEKESNATGDIIYLDVGKDEGVEPGDVFNILDEGGLVKSSWWDSGGIAKIKAKARVILVTEEGSTAYIFSSSGATFYGNQAVYTQER